MNRKIKLILTEDEEASMHCALVEAVKVYKKYAQKGHYKEHWSRRANDAIALMGKLDDAEEVEA